MEIAASYSVLAENGSQHLSDSLPTELQGIGVLVTLLPTLSFSGRRPGGSRSTNCHIIKCAQMDGHIHGATANCFRYSSNGSTFRSSWSWLLLTIQLRLTIIQSLVLECGQGCHLGLDTSQPVQDGTGSGMSGHIKFLAAMNSVRTHYPARQLVELGLHSKEVLQGILLSNTFLQLTFNFHLIAYFVNPSTTHCNFTRTNPHSL